MLLPLAAAAYSVGATAVDTSGEGIAYATYRIYASGSDKPLVSNTTTIDGEVEQTLSAPGSYTMSLSYVGMRDTTLSFEVTPAAPVARLGKVVMHEAAEMLQGVTVTAQRPLVVKEIDRIGYDVQADPSAATSNVRDILRKVPMVSVQADGTIMVNGSSDFKIYKNGRPNNSMSRNAKDLFAALPASMIKKIEVITEPGAEYDAEGTAAILNIVTVENAVIKGVMGSVQAEMSTVEDAPMLGVWLSSQIDKVTVSAYGGYSHLGGKRLEQRMDVETTFPSSGTTRRQERELKYKGDLGYFGLEGSYELDSLNLFTAELSGYSHNLIPKSDFSTTREFDATGAETGSFSESLTSRDNRYFDMNASFNYQRSTRRKGETFILSYLLSTTDQRIDNTSAYSDFYGTLAQPYTGIASKYDLNFIEHTFQADWTRPVKIHNFNAGAKWIIRRNHSTDRRSYEGWQDINSDFKHITDIAAVYAQYGLRLGPVNLRAGLRYEYSRLKATYPDGSGEPFSANLNDLVPSAAASWQMSDASSLSATYAASISRPGISYLNPATVMAPGTLSRGNPDLESARRQSVKLQYMFINRNLNFNISADYAFVNNGISPIQYLTDGDVITSTYGNVGHARTLGLHGFVQWTITPKTRFMANGGADYARNSQEGLSLSRWSPRVFAQLSQQLPWRISAEAMLWYGSGGLNGVYGYGVSRFSQNSYHMLSLSRPFFKGDRLNVRFMVLQPFGSIERVYENRIVNGEYLQTSRTFTRQGFSLKFSVSYRFGSLNAQVKKTARKIENDDLVGRKSN